MSRVKVPTRLANITSALPAPSDTDNIAIPTGLEITKTDNLGGSSITGCAWYGRPRHGDHVYDRGQQFRTDQCERRLDHRRAAWHAQRCNVHGRGDRRCVRLHS